MVLGELFGIPLLLILVLDIILMIVMLFLEKEDPKSFLMWIVVMVFLPIIGFVLYLFIGQTFYMRRVFSVKGVDDSVLIEGLREERARIEAMKTEGNEKDAFVSEVAAYIQRSGGMAFTSGNSIDLLTEGEDKFRRLFEDIADAREYVFMEYYIIRNDDLGNRLMDLLAQKAEEGVEVRLLTDAFGNGKGPKEGIKRFQEAGGKFALFHKTVTLLLSPKKNNRNHRKIAVIDGRISYVGGFNIGDEYLGKGKLGHWRDTAVRIEGDAHAVCCLRFIADWNYSSRDDIPDPRKYIREDGNVGTDSMQLVSGGPDVVSENPVQFQYEGIAHYAKERLYIHTPYLAPNEAMNEFIRTAAMRGVDVRIIIPDKPDHPFVYWNNMSCANRLMRYGVRVYLYNNGFVHSKTLVADGRIGSVGSANMDDRSLRLNFETNAMIYSERVCRQMEEAFLKDLGHSTEYSCEEYSEKGFGNTVKVVVSSFFRGLA